MKQRLNALKHGLMLDITKLDDQVPIAKAAKNILNALRSYVGPGTIASELLLHRIAYKAVKLSLYEANRIEDVKSEEARYYLPMSNSLRLDLQQLERMVGSETPLNLDDYVNKKYGKKNEGKSKHNTNIAR